jgi:regulator of protease activity HflC (stomatin/prohibitin superfamily)
MVIFVIGCVILIAAVVIALIRCRQEDDLKVSIGIPIGLFIISAILIGAECIYTQDVGEAVVLRNFGGSLAGYTTEAGIKFKAPWQDALNWDIRNRLINFYRDADYAYDNGSYNGATVTINDSSGTKADCDVQVIYSINPDAVERLYADYGTQEAYVASYVSNDVRQTTRDCAGQFSTIQLLTDKESFAKSIQDTLTQRWADSGVVVESVSVQDIRYDQSITDAYAKAQSAQVEQTTAANQQETARIQGETKVIEAQKESEANQTLAQSLTQEVLMSQYIEALKAAADNGGLIVVPEGSQPIVGTSAN